MLGLGLCVNSNATGVGFIRGAATAIFDSYESRVLSDGGVVEGEYCFIRSVFLLGVRS